MAEKKGTSMQNEAGFHQFEVKFQYQDNEPIPFLLESYMFDMSVDEVKRGLLHLEQLNFIKDKPEEVKMYLQMPAEELADGDEKLVEMDGKRKLKEYKDDLTQCLAFKMLKNAQPLFTARR